MFCYMLKSRHKEASPRIPLGKLTTLPQTSESAGKEVNTLPTHTVDNQ